MAIWDKLLSASKDADLGKVFAEIGIEGVPRSNYSGLKVASLAQWILESGRGTSGLATIHYNFAGLKWRNEMDGFATKVVFDAPSETAEFCRFASPENFIKGYWKFISRSPYTGWEDHTESPKEYIEFLKLKNYATDPSYVAKVSNLFSEARGLFSVSSGGEPTPTGTWLKATDEAIYWMQGNRYIEKVDKVPVPDKDEFRVVLNDLRDWFSGAIYPIPGIMKIAQGDVPEPIKLKHEGNGDNGHTHEPPPRKPAFRWDASPNFNDRGATIDTIVLHNTVYSFSSAINTFKNTSSKTSAHYVISRTGEIVQMVKDEDRAWHAKDYNSRSIGIEHEATKTRRGFTDEMEKASIALIKYLMHKHNVGIDRVIPHRHDWNGTNVKTDCPNLVWPTERNFDDWKEENLRDGNETRSGNGGTDVVDPGTTTTVYIVKRGDTFSRIARNHGLLIDELKALNPGIRDINLIFPGQRIIVSSPGGTGTSSETSGIVDFPFNIAERFISNATGTHQPFVNGILGNGKITGGFMELSKAHSWKPTLRAIYLDGFLKTLSPSYRNIGIDYAINNSDVKAWYGGKVTKRGLERGYGNRVHIELDVEFELEGVSYTVYQAYAHLRSISVGVGDSIGQGESIGIMGGSSTRSSGGRLVLVQGAYDPHVDLDTYIRRGSERVSINPQLIDKQLGWRLI